MKANFNVLATESGTVNKLMVSEGAMVDIGGAIVMITLADEGAINQSGNEDTANDKKISSIQHSMQIEYLREAYKDGIVSPSEIVEQIFTQIDADGGVKKGNVWIE